MQSCQPEMKHLPMAPVLPPSQQGPVLDESGDMTSRTVVVLISLDTIACSVEHTTPISMACAGVRHCARFARLFSRRAAALLCALAADASVAGAHNTAACTPVACDGAAVSVPSSMR